MTLLYLIHLVVFVKGIFGLSPPCSTPVNSNSVVSWQSCGLDKDAWYGITKTPVNVNEAVSTCKSIGADLIYITSEQTDICAYYSLVLNRMENQFVVYSGRYFSAVDSWAWCPRYVYGTPIEEGCISVISGYENWLNNDDSLGNCMGGLIDGSNQEFGDYGWIQRDCDYINRNPAFALCRYECGSEVVTTEQPLTTVQPELPSQHLMYTMYTGASYNYGMIYSYVVENNNLIKQGQYNMPYAAQFPRLVYNSQKNVLEIIGDFYDGTNTNHMMMEVDNGSFTRVSNSLFVGDQYFKVAYTKNVGTVVFSGYNHGGATQLYIVTQNENWAAVTSTNKYLNPFETPDPTGYYYYYGVTEHQDTLYLIGGYCNGQYSSIVQSLNLKEVTSLQSAQARNWIQIGNLNSDVNYSAVQFLNDQLLVVGYKQNEATNVQFFDLNTMTAGSYTSVIDAGNSANGLIWPGMYVVNGGNVSIFGGSQASTSCIQQTTPEDDLDSKWKCLSASKSKLDGLEYQNTGYSIYLSYANFFVEP